MNEVRDILPLSDLEDAVREVSYRHWRFSIERVNEPVACHIVWVEFDTTDAKTGVPVHYRLGNTVPIDITRAGVQSVIAAAVFHAEDHETREFFKVGDRVPFDPHAGPNAVT